MNLSKRVLTALHYGFYFGDISPTQENLPFLILQVIAENSSAKSLDALLKSLSEKEQLQLICYACKHFREGSFFILHAPALRPYSALISNLRRNYYDVNQPLDKMEEHALQETKELHKLFSELIPLIVDSPVRVFEELEQLKKNASPLLYQMDQEGKKRAEQERDNLRKRFGTFNYSLEDFHRFVKLFGLRGHLTFTHLFGSSFQESSLLEKIRHLHEAFGNPLLSPDPHILPWYVIYVSTLLSHLEALCKNPARYLEGLNNMVFAATTKGKEIATLPFLPSFLQALRTFADTTHLPSLKEFPLFIFDESNGALFNKNRRYINKLNRQHKAAIIHISLEESLELARKLKVEPLISQLGITGGRNCQFLLAPVLGSAYKMGKKTVQEVLQMETAPLFRKHVLGEENCGSTLFMMDDDMELPEANLFSHALFASESMNHYACSHGYAYGRATKFSFNFPTLEELVKSPGLFFESTKWTLIPMHALLSECVTKPKFCLNIPFGNEEAHLQLPHYYNVFLQVSYHLSGTRYPTKKLPATPLAGLDESIEKRAPARLLLETTSALINASNDLGRSVLPWNDKPCFSSLGEVFKFIAKPEVKQQMQRRFWKNVYDLFFTEQEGFFIQRTLNNLIHLNVDKVLGRRQKKLGNLYKFYSRDALLCREFALAVLPHNEDPGLSALIHQIKQQLETKYSLNFQEYPLTQGFYLLFLAIGTGEFCDHIQLLMNEL